jgi:hypothetical protein
MVRGPNKIRQRDVTRVMRVLAAAGQTVARVEFDAVAGRLTFYTAVGGEERALAENEWEQFVREETAKQKAN